MKPLIVLEDNDLHFLQKMSERLTSLARGDYEIALGGESLKKGRLLFTNRKDPLHIQGLDVHLWDQPVDSKDPFTSFRFCGGRILDRFIRGKLGAEGGTWPTAGQTAWTGCHLSFSPTSASRINRTVIRRNLDAGSRLIYLPVKALYLIEDTFRRGPSDTLGDLLCLIAAGQPPEARELGAWLYFHDQGYMTFRLPDRADDLRDFEIQHLAQLVLLVSAYSQTSGDPACVWLDTEGLPLKKLTVLASLCDRVYIDRPSGGSSSAALARRELALFLAGLPPSCRVMELDRREEEDRASGL